MKRNPRLYGLSDSSEKAYSTAIHIRSFDDDNRVFVQLLCAKSRVSPGGGVVVYQEA